MSLSKTSKTELRGQVAIPTAPRVGWRLAAAGSMSGMLTNTILHPLDTIKTVRQTNPSAFNGLTPTLLAILRTRGPRGLYLGLLPAIFGSSLSTALYFGTYELVKQRLSTKFSQAWSNPRVRIPLTSMSAACGNIASSIIYVPKEVVKQQLQFAQSQNHMRAQTVISNLFANHGIRAFYRGYKATLLRNIPSAMIRFAAYEEFKRIVRRGKNADEKLAPHELVFAASMAGALSSACTTPMDVIKTGLATGVIQPGTSIPRAFAGILRTQGVHGLFVGIRPRVAWSALFAAVGFTSYEMCKALLTGQMAAARKNGRTVVKKTGLDANNEQRKTL